LFVSGLSCGALPQQAGLQGYYIISGPELAGAVVLKAQKAYKNGIKGVFNSKSIRGLCKIFGFLFGGSAGF
jgi:hypothetical protein